MEHGKPQSLNTGDPALPCQAADQRVMDKGPMGRSVSQRPTRADTPPGGFSLLEMMLVVTLILIVASISAPIYTSVVVRAREAVLRDHLYSLRARIDRFTLDNGRAPLRDRKSVV
jgi:prepilin-type N-terminal cleavage/methylation domain-containing protein